MKRTIFSSVGALALLAFLGLSTASAVDDPVRFLHALQDNRLPDIAVDYLKALKDDPKAPKAIKDVWDLEMSRSLRAAAKLAYNEKEAKDRMDEAEKYLKKFVEENPKRPEAIQAGAWWASITWDEILIEWRMGNDLKDAAAKAEAMAKVRTKIEEIQPRFEKAAVSYRESLKSIPQHQKKRIAEIAAEADQAQLRVPMCDLLLGMTYEANSAERKDKLTGAAKTLDSIFQPNRGNHLGVMAHYLHARCLQEMGRIDDAKEIFEEVLANQPEPIADSTNPRNRGPVVTGLEGFFSEVEMYYLRCVRATKPKEYFQEAKEWLTKYKITCEKTDGYQGVCFELVKALLEAADGEKSTETEKKAYQAVVKQILQAMLKVPSQYRKEVAELCKKIGIGGETGGGGAELAIEDADKAAKEKKWEKAAELYKKAAEAAVKAKDAKRASLIQNAVADCYFRLAYDQFNKSEFDKAAETLKLILRDKDMLATETAPKAASFALTVALNEYDTTTRSTEADAKEQQAKARKRVGDLAGGIIKLWPGKEEADNARLATARLELMDNRLEEAVKIFDAINPKSKHFPTAQYLAGYSCWRQYRMDKRAAEEKPADDEKAAEAAKAKREALRQNAISAIEKCMAALKAETNPDARALKTLNDCYLLLADIHLEGNDPKQAVAVLQPVIEALEKSEAKTLDDGTLRIFNGAVQAYLQLNDVEQAGKVAGLLLKLGPDTIPVNGALLIFVKRLDTERKKLQQTIDQGGGSQEMKQKLESYEGLLGKVLTAMSERKALTLTNSVWIAQTCVAAGLVDEAEKIANIVFERLENDAAFVEAAGDRIKTAVPHLRSLLIAIKRKKHKFDEALQQVESLLADNRNALPLWMERCNILQDWAKKNPEKYGEAVAHWDKLRNRLQNIKPSGKGPRKPSKPPEFFEATYQEAACLYAWAADKSTSNEDKVSRAETAKKILVQLLTMMPELNGPENVSRYRTLANRCDTLLGKEPTFGKGGAAKKP